MIRGVFLTNHLLNFAVQLLQIWLNEAVVHEISQILVTIFSPKHGDAHRLWAAGKAELVA